MKTTMRTIIGVTLIVLMGLTAWGLAGTLKEQKYINLGEAECQKGNYDTAVSLFTAGIELNQDNPYLYNDRGLSYLEAGDKDKAISDFSKAIELKPDFVDAYYNRGLAYFRQGSSSNREPFKNAISDFTKAIELKHDFVAAYYNRGLTYTQYYNRGKNYDETDKTDYHTKAVADFDKALALDPTYVLAYAGKGNAAYRNKEYAKAEEYFTKALESENQIIQKVGNKGLAGVYASKARSLKATEDYDKSIADYNKALALDPELGTAISHQASNYKIVGEYHKAIELYDRTIEMRKNDPTYKYMYSAYQGKGDCYYKLGNYDKAIEMYNKAIEECAKNYPSMSYCIYAGIGNVHLALKEYDKAMENYNKTIELAEKEDTHVADAYKGLGTAYKELGRTAEAREALEKAKALYEEYGEAGHEKSENIVEIQKLLKEL